MINIHLYIYIYIYIYKQKIIQSQALTLKLVKIGALKIHATTNATTKYYSYINSLQTVPLGGHFRISDFGFPGFLYLFKINYFRGTFTIVET